jgi:hypothetical protein
LQQKSCSKKVAAKKLEKVLKLENEKTENKLQVSQKSCSKKIESGK